MILHLILCPQSFNLLIITFNIWVSCHLSPSCYVSFHSLLLLCIHFRDVNCCNYNHTSTIHNHHHLCRLLKPLHTTKNNLGNGLNFKCTQMPVCDPTHYTTLIAHAQSLSLMFLWKNYFSIFILVLLTRLFVVTRLKNLTVRFFWDCFKIRWWFIDAMLKITYFVIYKSREKTRKSRM